MLGEWGYEIRFKLDESQEKQYNKLCNEAKKFERKVNKRLSEERKHKRERKLATR